MHPVARVIAILVEPGRRLRLHDAVRRAGYGSEVLCFGRRADLAATVTDMAVDIVVLGPKDAEGTATAPLVRWLREGFPSIAVLGYCAAIPGESCEMLALARAGVHGLMLRDVDDIGAALRHALLGALRVSAEEAVLREVGPMPETGRSIMEYSVRRARERSSVVAAAHAIGVHRRTLVNRLSAAGLPGPREMLCWGRLLVASRLLEDGRRTVGLVADELGFPTDVALRKMLRRYTGLTARELRDGRGLTRVLAAFRARSAPARAVSACRDAPMKE